MSDREMRLLLNDVIADIEAGRVKPRRRFGRLKAVLGGGALAATLALSGCDAESAPVYGVPPDATVQYDAESDTDAQAQADAESDIDAQAEADAAGAELEQQFLTEVNDIKAKMAEGQAYLQELAETGEDKADEIKSKIASFFD